jgi:hypothetical protein
MFSNSFFYRKSCRLWDNVEKIVQPIMSQVTIRRILFRIPKATKHALRICYNKCLSTASTVCRNAPSCYAIRTLLCLVSIVVVRWESVLVWLWVFVPYRCVRNVALHSWPFRLSARRPTRLHVCPYGRTPFTPQPIFMKFYNGGIYKFG